MGATPVGGSAFWARVATPCMIRISIPSLSVRGADPGKSLRLGPRCVRSARASAIDGSVATQPAHQPYVLVVDDEDHISEMVAMGLGFNGFEVERAASGRGALDAIAQRRPDLVVLDVMLP